MNLLEQLTQEAKQFIRVDTKSNVKLRLDFDGMCAQILNKYKIDFSPSELERSLVVELEKVEGELISEDIFDAISLYIAKKIIWLHVENQKEQEQRTKELRWVNEVTNPKERSDRMAEVYRRRAERHSSV